ncbi:MAG: hypothetical protein H6Q89_3074 [Myxococcaceae bacterium]|nr:hypothetical protein [Myxococcaceae bacterium]
MRPSGKVNLIAVVILGAVAYGIWWVITFSGIYLDNIDVKDAVEGAYNLSNRQDDATIAGSIVGKTNLSTLGNHEEDDGYGTIKTVGGLGLKDENIVITRDEVAKRISIVVSYQRKVLLKPTSKVKFVKFRVAREGPIPAL